MHACSCAECFAANANCDATDGCVRIIDAAGDAARLSASEARRAEATALPPGTPRAARERGAPSAVRETLRGVHVREVPGLRLLLDAVTEAQEREALACIAADGGVPANNIHRAGQWGWRFFTWNRVPPMSPADRLAPLPRWMRDVVAALEAADGAREYLPSREEWGSGVQHALLNEYEPGDGVTPHTDDLFYWTSWVLGLSLGSDVTMRFHPPPPAADACDACACLPPGPVEVRLPRRSVYVLSGDARWTWKHEIARATEDTVDGQLVPRGYRASVTLRGIAARWLPPELVDGVVTGSSEA